MTQPLHNLRPGQRVRVSFEGRVVARDDVPGGAAIQVGGESIWAVPASATVEALSMAADPPSSSAPEGQVSEVRIRTHKWCPFGQSLPQPQRALVEVGQLDEDGRFVADSAHLMLDVTDARNPKLEISLDQLPDERREALSHFGGGWNRSLASMPDWMRQEYSV